MSLALTLLAAFAAAAALHAAATRRERAMLAWLGLAAGLVPGALAIAPPLLGLALRRRVPTSAWIAAGAVMTAALAVQSPRAPALPLPVLPPLVALYAGLAASHVASTASMWRHPRQIVGAASMLAPFAILLDPLVGVLLTITSLAVSSRIPHPLRAANDNRPAPHPFTSPRPTTLLVPRSLASIR